MISGLVGLKTNMSLELYFSWQFLQNTVMVFPHSIYLFDLPFLTAHYYTQGVIQFDLKMKTLLAPPSFIHSFLKKTVEHRQCVAYYAGIREPAVSKSR